MNNNNNNRNNIFDIIPFNFKSISLSQFKLVLKYHCAFNSDRPYLLHIYDCNRNSLNWSRKLELYFNIPLDEHDPGYDISASILRNDIIKVCRGWANEFSHLLPNPDLYYLEIIDHPGYEN